MMQRIQKIRYARLRICVCGCLWVAGLMVAGSDGPYMPWLNSLGLLVFMGASLALGRILPALDKPGSEPKGTNARVRTLITIKKGSKLNTRIALGV